MILRTITQYFISAVYQAMLHRAIIFKNRKLGGQPYIKDFRKELKKGNKIAIKMCMTCYIHASQLKYIKIAETSLTKSWMSVWFFHSLFKLVDVWNVVAAENLKDHSKTWLS